jgi:protein MPE1
MKRTTGIPRSFLKTVENPGANATQGVMITPEGGFVVAQPDMYALRRAALREQCPERLGSASWQKQLSRRAKALTEAEVREREPSDASLACPIDSKLFRDAVKTPCCAKTYCEDCIQSHLLERDFVCPNCSHKVPGLDKLRPDVASQAKVAAYIDKTIEESKDHEETADVLVTTNLTVSGSRPLRTTCPELLSQSGTDVPAAASSGHVAEPADALDPASMPQIIADSVPQLQAQVQQLALMLQNPALPKTVRAQTEVQHQQLQMQLQQAQAIAHALAASHAQPPMASASGMPGMGAGGMDGFAGMGHLGAGFGPNGGWNPQFGAAGSVAGEESAYQRLPVNNRRRNLKRERPSDFVEIAGADGNAKQARYWE